MQYTDRILGGVTGGLGLLCLYEAYRVWNGWDGTGTMALIVGGIFIVISIFFLLSPSREATPTNWFGKKDGLALGIIGGSFALYIATMKWVGFPIATWLYLALIAKYMSHRSIIIILIWTGAVAVVTYVIFKKYLGMYLPSGIIGI